MRTLILLAAFMVLLLAVRRPTQPGPYIILAGLLGYLLYRVFVWRFGTKEQSERLAGFERKVFANKRVGVWLVVLMAVMVIVGIVAGVVLPLLE